MGRRSRAPTRRRPSCRRSSTSSRTRSASTALGADRAEGHPAPRPARHRQDAAGQGGRQRVRREVLLAVGGRVRGDVRRPRRRAHPAPVRDRARQPPGDHLHRRDRRGRRRARLGQQLRARADAQPAAGRDGRLQQLRRPRRDRGLEPARQARPGAAAPRPLRPPDLRLPARRRPAARRSCACTPRASRSARTCDLEHDRAPDLGPDRRRPRQPLQRGGDLRRPRAPRRAGRRPTSTPRSSASSPACSRAARSTSTSAASSPSTRPATRCAPSCCPASTASTRSRSSRAAGRWATR